MVKLLLVISLIVISLCSCGVNRESQGVDLPTHIQEGGVEFDPSSLKGEFVPLAPPVIIDGSPEESGAHN